MHPPNKVIRGFDPLCSFFLAHQLLLPIPFLLQLLGDLLRSLGLFLLPNLDLVDLVLIVVLGKLLDALQSPVECHDGALGAVHHPFVTSQVSDKGRNVVLIVLRHVSVLPEKRLDIGLGEAGYDNGILVVQICVGILVQTMASVIIDIGRPTPLWLSKHVEGTP